MHAMIVYAHAWADAMVHPSYWKFVRYESFYGPLMHPYAEKLQESSVIYSGPDWENTI